MFILTDTETVCWKGCFLLKKEYEALEIEIKEFRTVDIMEPSGVEDGGEGEDWF